MKATYIVGEEVLMLRYQLPLLLTLIFHHSRQVCDNVIEIKKY